MILVIGDAMIDEYVFVEITRISPEAPIPIMKRLSSEERPGGALNVCANIISLGEESLFLGCDANLISPTQWMVRDPTRVTTWKTRFIAHGGQQVARLDEESTHDLSDETEFQLIGLFREAMRLLPSVVVISDYAKGVCTTRVCQEVISVCLSAGIPVIVDPKRADWTRYCDATIITPNEREFVSAPMAANWSGDILVTLGERGVQLRRHGKTHEYPSEARQVFDVTGAGDTLVAGLAVAMSSGQWLIDAVKFANRCAGIAVGQRGTATVTMRDFKTSLGDSDE